MYVLFHLAREYVLSTNHTLFMQYTQVYFILRQLHDNQCNVKWHIKVAFELSPKFVILLQDLYSIQLERINDRYY